MMELRRPSALVISSLCVFATCITFLVFVLNNDPELTGQRLSSSNDFRSTKVNVWSELSEDEAINVYNYLLEDLSELNLTKHPKTNHDSFIYFVETLRPNKTDTLPYINDDGDRPERWAKAAVSRTFDDGPYMVYYMIGPLPVSPKTQVLPLHYIFNSGQNYVKNPVQDFVSIFDIGFDIAENISDITEELLGAKADRNNPDNPNGLVCWPRGSRVQSGGFTLWFQIFRPGIASGARTLLPQGIYAKVDAKSTSTSNWVVGQYYYNGVLYENVEDFRVAVRDPNFISTPSNDDGSWTDTEDFESQSDGRQLPPPISIQPYGPRYKLDREQQFVSWFGFGFYITTSQATGVSLFDIRFKGEPVMYELGLQEALSHYAGDDPVQGGLEFLDTFFGMGRLYELVPGYDCPAYADYLDTKWYQLNNTERFPNGICIFEFTSDYLLSRHTAQHSVTASRNTFLAVRSVSTVGNYDYTIEYLFYMDGTIEVKMRASGFIFAAFYPANKTKNEDKYGHRLQNAMSSSMHDHVINFKADMDVAGPVNDMVRLAIEPFTASYSWDKPEVDQRNTMHLVEYPVTEETALDWPKNSGEFYIVYNSNKTNAWGEKRGYRITSGTTSHLTIQNSTTLGDSARWAEHDLWVLRRKDIEPRSADPLNYFTPHDPLINFNKMANRESLNSSGSDAYDGDLVVYFNLGSHHVPHSGDIPNTLMHTSASSLMFIPHNFHDRDPSRQSVQGVRLQMKGKGSGGFAGEPDDESINDDLRSRKDRRRSDDKKHGIRYFGRQYNQALKLPLDAIEPDLQPYQTRDVSDLSYNGSAAGVMII